MRSAPIRCTAAHPANPHRLCNAILAVAIEATVEIRNPSELVAGCMEIQCKRCGVRFVVCPVERVL